MYNRLKFSVVPFRLCAKFDTFCIKFMEAKGKYFWTL